MKIVLVTGGFDPIHSGHIDYFNSARQLGDKLVVGLNSDKWLSRKKGQPFMTWQDRFQIIKHLKMVDFVISFNDDDNSAKLAIKLVQQTFPNDIIIFANGGDRTKENVPELDVAGVDFVFNVGAKKTTSSSTLLESWTSSHH